MLIVQIKYTIVTQKQNMVFVDKIVVVIVKILCLNNYNAKEQRAVYGQIRLFLFHKLIKEQSYGG